nr:Methionine aminotransferase [Candidatus Pantoea persica]
MSALTIFTDTEATLPVWHSNDAEMIHERLNAKNVRFERWAADRELGENPEPAAVIEAYQYAIDRLASEKGYQGWDVISMCADHPHKAVLREKFLAEHTDGEDEVRFFVEGTGLFCLHLDG